MQNTKQKVVALNNAATTTIGKLRHTAKMNGIGIYDRDRGFDLDEAIREVGRPNE